MNIKLTVVYLDLVTSSTFTNEIQKQGGAELTRTFINQIHNLVETAFNTVANRSEYDEFHSLGGDGYRISFKNVNDAYQFVEYFCKSVEEIDNNEPNRRKRIFRVGAATGTVHFDSSQSGLRRIEGSNVLVPVSRLVQANPPGYFYVDQETFNNFNEDIKNKFENESVSVPGKNHEGTITAYRCQMFSNLDSSQKTQPTKPLIANYLFFIIEPKPNTNKPEFLIKSEFVQFENNECEKELKRFPIQLSEEEEFRSYLEKEIIDYVYKSIQEMKKELKKQNIILCSSLIIELFVPISLLGADFDIKQIPDESGSQRIPICNLYPLIVRSYERFFKHDINDQSIILYREKFRLLQEFINTNNTQKFIQNTDVYHLINDHFPASKARYKIFSKILREGFPLCLWTRYKTIDDTTVSENFRRILDIDSGSHHNFCKFYRIHRNIHDIRKNNMERRTDFGYNLGVLFDHDKIPTGANQLISPNMARNV
ncbi:hypothetical protein SR1949_17430 [Sphaerospermopsis reniformis]|uniref:vWA-MoxR associated protein C-terminal domain-containing protein n=2 Tax=Sphaerospermopsis reniformis TaxID=531300 RepID=A0A479ZVR2_9CYAN|nr:hypothetical protein SR1949_17430 [Sphaerospermopsis reniformis]